jgi:hypothetical protein
VVDHPALGPGGHRFDPCYQNKTADKKTATNKGFKPLLVSSQATKLVVVCEDTNSSTDNEPIEKIMKYTGLSKTEIEKLR